LFIFFFLFLQAVTGHFIEDSLNVLFRDKVFAEHYFWIFNNPRIEVVELGLIFATKIYLSYLQVMRMNLILILATHEADLDLGVFAGRIGRAGSLLLHIKIKIKRYHLEPKLLSLIWIFCFFISEGHKVSGILAELLCNIHQSPFLQSSLIHLGIVFVKSCANEAIFEVVCMDY